MSELINDPRYWARRLREAPPAHRYQSVFRCPPDRWARIEEVHRGILERHVDNEDWILDVGCGYGRLLTLLPKRWHGDYRGIDLSPEFIRTARTDFPDWPRLRFEVCDIAEPLHYAWCNPPVFDLAVVISVRPMIKRHLGDERWKSMEDNVKAATAKILYLEYDENDPGELVKVQR